MLRTVEWSSGLKSGYIHKGPGYGEDVGINK